MLVYLFILFIFVTMMMLYPILIYMEINRLDKFNLVPGQNSVPGNFICLFCHCWLITPHQNYPMEVVMFDFSMSLT